MSCTFWVRRKRIAAQIREQERLKAVEPIEEAVEETKTTAKKSTKKAVKNDADERTD